MPSLRELPARAQRAIINAVNPGVRKPSAYVRPRIQRVAGDGTATAVAQSAPAPHAPPWARRQRKRRVECAIHGKIRDHRRLIVDGLGGFRCPPDLPCC